MSRRTHLAFLVILSFSGAPVAGAQGWFSKLTDKAKEVAAKKVEENVAQRADQGTQAALDAAAGGIKCLFTDHACIKKAKDDGKAAVLVNKQGTSVNAQGVVVPDTTAKSATPAGTNGEPPPLPASQPVQPKARPTSPTPAVPTH